MTREFECRANYRHTNKLSLVPYKNPRSGTQDNSRRGALIKTR